MDMAADPTEAAREDTDRVAAMEAARDTAVDRVEVRETPERFSQIFTFGTFRLRRLLRRSVSAREKKIISY